MESRRADLALWTGFLAGPIVFLAYELLAYTLVQKACLHEDKWLLHVASVVALVLITLAGLLSFRQYVRVGSGPTDEGMPGDSRARFMAVCGMALCTLSFIVTIAGWIPTFVLQACD